jgi:hypothetical protein
MNLTNNNYFYDMHHNQLMAGVILGKKNSWQGLKDMLSRGQVGVHAELGVNQVVLVSL